MQLSAAGAGALLACAVSAAAYRARALRAGGALAAACVGTLTYATGGLGFTLVLFAFFVPAVALSRLGKRRKAALTDIGKGGPRDAWQVLANGGAATACAVAFGVTHDARWAAAFAGAYAAAAADTFATEIGTLARHAPRSIVTGRRIATGISGGVTVPGTLAEIAGAAWVAFAAFALTVVPSAPRAFGAVALAGIAGATVDSLLGGTVQELRRCATCATTCETNPHVCGTPTERVRGIAGFSNDHVNLAATVAGALAAFVLL